MNELDKDVRLLRRNLAKGFISNAEIDRLKATLPDISDQADYFDPEAPEVPEVEAQASAPTE